MNSPVTCRVLVSMISAGLQRKRMSPKWREMAARLRCLRHRRSCSWSCRSTEVIRRSRVEEVKDSKMAPSFSLLCLLVAAVVFAPTGTSATREHIVGGGFGWRIPPNASFYGDWAKTRTFVVGDRLVFLYTTGLHSLIEVSAADFPNCTQNTVLDMRHNGPLILPITQAGSHYYYCGIGMHCEAGQKLSINVLTTLPAPAPEGQDKVGSKSEAGLGRHVIPLACVVVYLVHLMFL